MEELQVIQENGLRTDLYAFKETPHGTIGMVRVELDNGKTGVSSLVEIALSIDTPTGAVFGVYLKGLNFEQVTFKELLPKPIEIQAQPSPNAIIKYIFRVAKEILTGDSTK